MNKDTNKNILNVPPESKSNPKVIRKEKETHIILPNELLDRISEYEFRNIIDFLTSPLFFKFNETVYKSYEAKSSRTRIGIFMEQKGHYTGGRYYTFCIALILNQFADVTFITDKPLPFLKDFECWKNLPEIITDTKFGDNIKENNFDIVLGAPIRGGLHAAVYAEKFNIPLYLLMFESPNYVSKYRGGIDAGEEFWADYKKCMLKANKIITISKTSQYYIKEWLVERPDLEVAVVYPCINELVARKVSKTRITRDNGVVFNTRMAPFKNPVPILRELGKKGFKSPIHIIGKVWSDAKSNIQKLKENYGLDIRMYGTISDKKKFGLIKQSGVMMFPSKFEGFGLPPLEAMYFHKPVVAYDIPVLREVYGDNLIYIELNNYKAFATALIKYSKKKYSESKYLGVKEMYGVSCMVGGLLDIFKPLKLSVGVIAYNDEHYIKSALDSIYDMAGEIIIVEGGVKGFPDVKDTGMSSDKTTSIIQKYINKKDWACKITYITPPNRPWKSKIEMQNEIAKRITGDIYMKCDTDEIWKEEDIRKVLKIFEEDDKAVVVRVPFLHFWTNFKTVARDAGGKWSIKIPRFWRWSKSFIHKRSFNGFVDMDNHEQKVWTPNYKVVEAEGVVCYHFGYVKPLKTIERKLEYYKGRGIEKVVHPYRYGAWKKLKDPTQPTQDARSWAEEIDIELPKSLDGHEFEGVEDVR